MRGAANRENQRYVHKSVFWYAQDDGRVPDGSVSVVFLAGGSGKRMKVYNAMHYISPDCKACLV